MRDGARLDLVTRLYDLADLPCLERLIFSVVAQDGDAGLHLHVMLQRFSFDEVRAVREATRDLRRLNDTVSVTLHNWDFPTPFDLRVPLLNWGLEVAQGRYCICVDVFDELRPDACANLVDRLRTTGAAIAVGGARVEPASWWGHVVMPLPNQPAATASILAIDRDRVSIKDCVFKSGDAAAETADFIERVGFSYEVDVGWRCEIVATRHVLDDARSETNRIFPEDGFQAASPALPQNPNI